MVLAEHLIARAVLGGTSDMLGDLARAQALAVRARDDRRRWRGESAEAVAIACQAATMAEDYRAALAHGRHGDDGAATAAEAADVRVRAHVGLASIALGLVDPAPDLIGLPEFDQARLQALLDRAQGGNPEPAWRRALAAAENDQQRATALAGLAATGTVDLPGLQDFEVAYPGPGAFVRATVDIARGDAAAAVRRLRAAEGDSPQAALLLAQAQENVGRIQIAAETLTEAARRFSDPSLGLAAVRVHLRLGAHDDAERTAVALLATVPHDWSGRAELLSLAAHGAAGRGDLETAVELAHTACQVDPYDTDRRWALVRLRLATGQLEQAAAALRAHPDRLQSNTREQARTWLAVLHEAGTAREADLAATDLWQQFPDDEELLASVVALVTVGVPSESTEVTSAATDAESTHETAPHPVAESYLRRFPNGGIRAVKIDDDDDVDTMLDKLSEHVRVDRQASRARRELHGRLARQELPLGVLASVARRPYTTLLLSHGFGVLPGTSPDPAEHDLSVADAHAALDGPALLDASALLTLAALPQPSARLLIAALSRHEVLDETLADIRRARRDAKMRSDLTIVWDDVHQKAAAQQTPQVELDRQRRLADQLHGVAQKARRRTAAPADPRMGSDQHSPWWPTVHTAASNQRPLWADDSALRLLARGEGTTAFSTAALLDALLRAGRLDHTDHTHARLELIRSRTSTPADPDVLHELATEEDWAPQVAALTMFAPAAWANPHQAHRTFARAVARIAAARPDSLPDWLYLAVHGVGYAYNTQSAVAAELAATLLATALHVGAAQPTQAARLLAAARAALQETAHDPDHPGDPLPRAVALLHEAYSAALAGTATPYLLALFSATSDADRTSVTRTLLTTSSPGLGVLELPTQA